MTRELAPGWSWLQLEAFASLEPNAITDGPFGSNLKTSDYVEGGEVRVIRLGNIGVGDFLDHDRSFVSAEKFEGLKKHEARPGDLVVAALAEPVGRCVEVPRHIGKAMVKADCIRVRVNPAFDHRYLLHALNSPGGRSRAEAAAHGMGRLRMNLGDLRALQVPTAPPNEQRRIVAKLESLQARSRRAREALDAVPPLLEKLRQSILAAAFRGDLTKDWRAKNKDVEPASELLKRIRVERRKKWEEGELAKMRAKGKAPGDERWKGKYKEPELVDTAGLPELPEGWCWASVDDVCELQLGQQRAPIHAAAEKTYPYIRTANIKWDGLDLSDVKRMGFPDLERYRLQPGDVLLSEASGSATEVGKPAIWRGEIADCCYQKTLLRARPASQDVASEWIHLSFLADALLGRFARMAPGVGILHLTADRMFAWPVAMPPLAEQQRILEQTRSGLSTVARLEGLVERTGRSEAALARSVLAKAFRGELVPQDPNDEPADVTLARLRSTPPSASEASSRNTVTPSHRPRRVAPREEPTDG